MDVDVLKLSEVSAATVFLACGKRAA